MTRLNEYIFLCEGNQSEILTPEIHHELIRKGGSPTAERMKLDKITCNIQQVRKDRNKL